MRHRHIAGTLLALITVAGVPAEAPQRIERGNLIYEGVPASIAARMKASFSKGQFFNEHIRDRFAFARSEADEAE